MKALFLGGLAGGSRRASWRELTDRTGRPTILADRTDQARLAPRLAEADIVVGLIWRADFPPAPRLKLLQSVATGVDLIDLAAVPRGVTCATSSATRRRSPNT